jgi:hypothetical protein
MYRRTPKPISANIPNTVTQTLAPVARSVCGHVCRGYFDALRQTEIDRNGMTTLNSANNASRTPSIAGSGIPHPTTVHVPLTHQRNVSGAPISQKACQRATWPVISFLRNVMGSSKLGQSKLGSKQWRPATSLTMRNFQPTVSGHNFSQYWWHLARS